MAGSLTRDVRTLFAHDGPGAAEVTVCVPLHDYERYVAAALDSVHAQSLPAIALTVVDDQSSDGGAALVRGWMQAHVERFTRLRLLQHASNEGLAPARNSAIRDAETPFVFLLDADNELYPRALEQLLAALVDGDSAFAYSIMEQFGTASELVGCDAWSRDQIAHGNYVDAMAMVRRSAWEAVGGYRSMRTPGWEDYDFWCRLVEAGLDGTLVPQILCRYRVHTESMLRSSTNTLRNHLEVCEEIAQAHPWVELGGRSLGAEPWRKSSLARRIASVPPLGRLPLQLIDRLNDEARRTSRMARNNATRWGAVRESLRALRSRPGSPTDVRMLGRVAGLCFDRGSARSLRAATRVDETSLDLAPEAGEQERREVASQARPPIRISVHASSQGSFLYREMAEQLAAGFEASGAFEVRHADETQDPVEDMDEHVVVAPHEFFALGRGRRWLTGQFQGFRRGMTCFVTERVGTPQLASSLPHALHARLVLTSCPQTAAALRRAGARATFFPLGHLAEPSLFDAARRVTSSDLRGKGLHVDLGDEPSGDRLSDRPIDLLFDGAYTRRRARFLARNAAFLSERPCCLLLPRLAEPAEGAKPSGRETSVATALARRAKIQLNVHASSQPHFEWHTMAVRGFGNRSLVVSEPCDDAPAGFEPGVHYLEQPLEQIPELLRWLLESPEGQERAERVRIAGFERMRERFDLRDWARELGRFYQREPRLSA